MNQEMWIDIVGYEGKYQVSSFGNVRSLDYRQTGKTKILKPFDSGRGYSKIKLCVDGKQNTLSIHRLVAKAFIPNPIGKREVNHINGNTKDNNVENLEWVTSKENMQLAYRNGQVKLPRVFPVVQLLKNGQVVRRWECASIAALTIGIDASSLTKCCKGKLKHCGGFMWKYEADMEATYLLEKENN